MLLGMGYTTGPIFDHANFSPRVNHPNSSSTAVCLRHALVLSNHEQMKGIYATVSTDQPYHPVIL